MIKKCMSLAIVLVLSVSGILAAQDGIEDKIDSLLNDFKRASVPGVSLAVMKDGDIVYSKGFGEAQIEYGIKITPTTPFHAASVSKQFTAFAILLLAEQGKLDLKEDIRTYLPFVPDFGTTITVGQVCHHLSGMRDHWSLLMLSGTNPRDVITTRNIIDLVKRQKELNFIPGSKMLYCNTGYVLLTQIVEKVSGVSFREWTTKNIFEPLEMTNTHFHVDATALVGGRAYGYELDQRRNPVKALLNISYAGATSLFTTAEDLLKWMRNFETKKVGSKETIAKMTEVGVLNDGRKTSYGFGLYVSSYRGVKFIGHDGMDPGFKSIVKHYPEHKLAIALLSNCAAVNVGQIEREIADIFIADSYEPLPEMKPDQAKDEIDETPVELTPDQLQMYCGSYIFMNKHLIRIEMEDKKLYLCEDGEGKVELQPLVNDSFVSVKKPVRLTFQRDNSGSIAKLTLLVGNNQINGQKADSISFTEKQLKEFEGFYYSDEIDTLYEVIVRGEQISLYHLKNGEIPLKAKDPRTFLANTWYLNTVNFTYDETGSINGIVMNANRVWGLKFKKLEHFQ